MTPPRRLEIDHPLYPDALRLLPQPPPVIHSRGRIELLSRPGIAVIGTRAHTTYGRDATVSFVLGLARAGYTIVSGLARGIDGIAHATALDVGGDTVAVLGTGLDVPYPREHEQLAATIAEHGCLVSEFPDGTPPLKYHFPQRNRIIAGLARAVLVVEAPQKSGAMITAEYALEEGKEVFAVPGPINSAASAGTNRLIQEGAGLVTTPAEIIQALASRTGEPIPEPLATHVDSTLPAPDAWDLGPAASDLSKRIWAALTNGAKDMESLATHTGAEPGPLAAALLELELAGLIERLPGAHYARVPGRFHG